MFQRGSVDAINHIDLYDNCLLNGASKITCLVNLLLLSIVIAVLPVENRYYKNL